MNIFSRTAISILLPATLALAGCGGSTLPNPIQKPSGFLPDYSLLKQVPNTPKGTEIYNYKSPSVQRGDYTSVIVDPVIVYQSTTTKTEANASADLATAAQAEEVRASIQAGIQTVVSRKIPLTSTAGPGVARLSVAITGAMLEKEGLKPWNLIPVSAVITMASKASGKDEKTPAIMVELKFVDSSTGKLLRETVTVIHGDGFRDKANTDAEFQQLAEQWVKDALKYSSAQS